MHYSVANDATCSQRQLLSSHACGTQRARDQKLTILGITVKDHETGSDLGGKEAPRARLERATYCLGGSCSIR